MNRAERRAEQRRIKQHRNHGKYVVPMSGEQNRWAEIICHRCHCHVAYMNWIDYREFKMYDEEQDRQANQMQQLQDYLTSSTTYVNDNETQTNMRNTG